MAYLDTLRKKAPNLIGVGSALTNYSQDITWKKGVDRDTVKQTLMSLSKNNVNLVGIKNRRNRNKLLTSGLRSNTQLTSSKQSPDGISPDRNMSPLRRRIAAHNRLLQRNVTSTEMPSVHHRSMGKPNRDIMSRTSNRSNEIVRRVELQ